MTVYIYKDGKDVPCTDSMEDCIKQAGMTDSEYKQFLEYKDKIEKATGEKFT